MNKKAQIATVIAVLLGIFLVVITAIKFDWVGMIVRGDKIINFNNNDVNDKKPEENNSNNNNEETNDGNNSNEEASIVNLVCSKASDTTDLQTSITYSYSFFDSELLSSEANVVATYTLPETKANFDEFIKSYRDLVSLYTNNPTITVNEEIGTNDYTYYEKIDYSSETFDTDASSLNFNKKSTVAEVTNHYKLLGFTCTQS